MDDVIQKESVLAQMSRENKTSVEIDRVEYDGEVKMYIKGAEFPCKTAPSADCLWSVNIIKKSITEFIRVITAPQFYPSFVVIFFLPKRKLLTRILESFNRISNGVLRPYKNYKFLSRDIKMNLTAAARGVGKITELFLIHYKIDQKIAHRTADTLAHFIEFDGAYRFRLIDIIACEVK